jgi:hypothetical protein
LLSVLLTFTIIVCFIALLLGMIKPVWVLKGDTVQNKTRGKVFLIYGLGMVALFVVTIMTLPETDTFVTEQVSTPTEQALSEEQIKLPESIVETTEPASIPTEQVFSEEQILHP